MKNWSVEYEQNHTVKDLSLQKNAQACIDYGKSRSNVHQHILNEDSGSDVWRHTFSQSTRCRPWRHEHILDLEETLRTHSERIVGFNENLQLSFF